MLHAGDGEGRDAMPGRQFFCLANSTDKPSQNLAGQHAREQPNQTRRGEGGLDRADAITGSGFLSGGIVPRTKNAICIFGSLNDLVDG